MYTWTEILLNIFHTLPDRVIYSNTSLFKRKKTLTDVRNYTTIGRYWTVSSIYVLTHIKAVGTLYCILIYILQSYTIRRLINALRQQFMKGTKLSENNKCNKSCIQFLLQQFKLPWLLHLTLFFKHLHFLFVQQWRTQDFRLGGKIC